MNNDKSTFESGDNPNQKRNEKISKAVAVIGLLGTLAVFISYSSNEMKSGPKSFNAFGNVDKSIGSITISPESQPLHNPYFSDGENDNQLSPTKQEINLPKTDDVRVHEGDLYGKWYGIPVADIKNVYPKFNDNNDDDGVVWFNQQYVKIEVQSDSIASDPASETK